MSFDLAISQYNDLVFAANRDLLGVSGTALIDQRIRTRLKIKRGSWVFDFRKTLGSRLDMVLSLGTNQAFSQVIAYVHEALDQMEDITITHVDVKLDPSDNRESTILVIVGYTFSDAASQAPLNPANEQIEAQESVISFQL